MLLLGDFQAFAGEESSLQRNTEDLLPYTSLLRIGVRCDTSPSISASSHKVIYFGNFKMGESDSLNPEGSRRHSSERQSPVRPAIYGEHINLFLLSYGQPV